MAPPLTKRRIKDRDNASPSPASESGSWTSASDDSSNEQQKSIVENELRNVSLGALADAQASLTPAKRDTRTNTNSSADKLNLLRSRLAELKDEKQVSKKRKRESGDQAEQLDDSDSGPETGPSTYHDRDTAPTRSSKHAPTVQSSKYAVSRARTVIDLPPAENPYHSRDPRFSSLSGRVDERKVERDYSFLTEYRVAEVQALKDSLKNAKKNKAGEEVVEELKRDVGAMENKLRADRDKQRELDVLQRHRKEERDRAKEGKRPFYLSSSQIKKKAREEKWNSMNAKERDKATKKKRTKESQKEKKSMPRFAKSPKQKDVT